MGKSGMQYGGNGDDGGYVDYENRPRVEGDGQVVVERPVYETPPEGWHLATVWGFKDLPDAYDYFEGTKHKVEWSFRLSNLTTTDGKPFFVTQRFNFSASPKSNLVQFREEVLGRSLSTDERYRWNVNDYFDKQINVLLTHKKDKEGRTWANITKFAPVVPAAPAAQTAPPAPPESAPQPAPEVEAKATGTDNAVALNPNARQGQGDEDLPF